jgi:signal transduction histidine kinase
MTSSGIQRRKIELLLDGVERLPTLPGVAQHVLPLAMAERPNARRLAQVIESDAALAARTLALAVRLGRPVERLRSVEDVLAAVPLEELAADLLTLEVVDLRTLRDGRLKRLWLHNLAVAMAAQVIAGRLGTVPPQEAQLAGLLHDIGLIALPMLMPKAFRQVLDRLEADGRDPLEVEREVFGVDHVVVGKRLAQRWGLSETIQNAAWLHHQTNVALPGEDKSLQMARVVSLADHITRREGYAFYTSEEVHGSSAEAAERLGLSGAQADQIARQVAGALSQNAEAIGLEEEPTPGQLWQLAVRANARLGAVYRDVSDRWRDLSNQTRRADVLVKLNARVAACRATREILETVAETARETLDLRLVVPYLLGGGYEYIEGVLSTDSGGLEDHFLLEVSKSETLETLLADTPVPPASGTVPTRAERAESWLFERLGPRLGEGPFYTVPMIVQEAKVGGLVFAPRDPGRDLSRHEMAELTALASMAGLALKRSMAESDLTVLSEELAQAGRDLQLAQESLLERRNVASLSEMAAGAAHEINNPLAIISGRAQQLLSDESDDEKQEMLRSVIQQADRIHEILAELRRFARPPAPKPTRIDPSALVARVAEGFQEEAAAASVELTVEQVPGVPEIAADADQVAEALGEVVRNALEACSDDRGATVTLMARSIPSEEAVRIVVVDDGSGMEPRDRARAFDPFFSGREAGRHRGLGLPKAFRAVQANGGQMSVESEPGQGTTVRLMFPAAGAATPEGAKAGAAPDTGAAASERR